jgi:CTP:phosphocholine cytidylyltransferase-like protein
MLARSFARINKLAWDMNERIVDVTITSVIEQDITLIARYGIDDITAPSGILVSTHQSGKADCDIHLPKNKAIELHLKLGNHKPLDWVAQVS